MYSLVPFWPNRCRCMYLNSSIQIFTPPQPLSGGNLEKQKMPNFIIYLDRCSCQVSCLLTQVIRFSIQTKFPLFTPLKVKFPKTPS